MLVHFGIRRMEIDNVRAVSSIRLPKQWTRRNSQPTHLEFIERFGPADQVQTNLLFYSLKEPLPAEEGRSFLQLLTGPIHQLTTPEIERNYAVLRYRTDVIDFRLKDAHMHLWNGMPVLQARGEWIKSGRRVFSLIAAGDNDCQSFQEITYTGFGSAYDDSLNEAYKALQTIRWVQKVRPDAKPTAGQLTDEDAADGSFDPIDTEEERISDLQI
jgi:hypothetical protein